MTRRRNRDDNVSEVERFVRQSLVFPAEEERDVSGFREREKIERCSRRRMKLPLRRAPARRETRNANAIGHGAFEVVEMLDSIDELMRVVRNADEPRWIVRDWPDKTKPADAHVLHRANCRRDVDGILRLVKDNSD